ncbi:MAG TPA: S8 family serine peptidase, partial [Ohtaekwangia sp.]|nr:S8 family serine peptidase [Ohtaekwangia sp.]
MMRSFFTAVLVLAGIAQVQGQVKQAQSYQLPAGATADDYIAGRVLVKVKPEYRDLFQAPSPGSRSSFVDGTIRPLAPAANNYKSRGARAQAFRPVVDITQYFEIAFDAGRSTVEYIDALYRSGYVEYAEPVFRERMQFQPGDALLSSQYYLAQIKAYEAWDVTQGSEAIVIGIVDSGGDLDHPDLASQLYINTADPVNGIDDDNNGYIDDYRGWDFSGADTLNVFEPDFAGDNDPSSYKSGPGFTHGTAVGACASAATDNGTGIAGVGFRTRLLYTKHFADNQKASSRSYNSNLYLGVLYAAQMG